MEKLLCNWLENNATIRKWALQAGTKWIVSFLKTLATKNPWTLDVLQVISVLIALWGALPAQLTQLGITEPAWLANYENLSVTACSIVAAILLQIPNAKGAGTPNVPVVTPIENIPAPVAEVKDNFVVSQEAKGK